LHSRIVYHDDVTCHILGSGTVAHNSISPCYHVYFVRYGTTHKRTAWGCRGCDHIPNDWKL